MKKDFTATNLNLLSIEGDTRKQRMTLMWTNQSSANSLLDDLGADSGTFDKAK